ncbi:helix-turn-helix domain-containing protein [Leptospira santarosai]|uniref:helix-turn-helix domain-containing protein n=1 Tax=Leptospira santarosai TaxID=28183 RepID=UPI00062D1440|nr:helix-turn-helix transcriptional regulator [Leptospira santarosai]MDI7175140.1 helix-turn-helix transcriptional regulator [Leptospira santarosai]MDI7194975.1 helix-turn-helix transcriptional regulator [Leptospira santarosai]MDI7219584.1 helix-turn-helix transcriptional regulator [Leptospira santarosai]MDO6399193.1 helix-turn-helix transcriptional regulator [Leptospira santarosai]MDO6404816.1 helix-turn-helix transcriptional regulator [Leptospira santarosai]
MNTFNLKTQAGRLAYIISETGLTQSRFGEEVGISKQQVSNIIAGEREISDPVAMVIEYKFGFQKVWVLSGNGNKKDQKRNSKEIEALNSDIQLLRKIERIPRVKQMIEDILILDSEDRAVIEDMIKRLRKKEE